MKQDQDTLHIQRIEVKSSNEQVKSSQEQAKSSQEHVEYSHSMTYNVLPLPKVLITAYFAWQKIKAHYRDKGKQVNSSNKKFKSCKVQVKSSHELVKYSHSQTIIFLPIPKALITATFV